MKIKLTEKTEFQIDWSIVIPYMILIFFIGQYFFNIFVGNIKFNAYFFEQSLMDWLGIFFLIGIIMSVKNRRGEKNG